MVEPSGLLAPNKDEVTRAPGPWPTGVSGDEAKRLWIQLARLLAYMSRLKISSVAIVPVGEGPTAPAFALELGAAAIHRGARVRVIRAEGLSVLDARKVAEEIPSQVEAGNLVIASVDSILQSDAGLAVVYASTAAVVVVPMGVARREAVQTTLDIIGRDRVLGCVASRSPGR